VVGVAHNGSDDGNNVKHELWATVVGRGSAVSRSEVVSRRAKTVSKRRERKSKMGYGGRRGGGGGGKHLYYDSPCAR
jgi:hypothetical protein